jgi:phosphatidate phosphatase APP1
VKGRVLAERAITRATGEESMWRDLVNTYRRFQSDEIAGARVIARYRDAVSESLTDAEGYFSLRLQPSLMEGGAVWHDVGLELGTAPGVAAVAPVLVPPSDADFGIISDIDDTIVQTNATSLVGMIRAVVKNAATRLPFPGVGSLYQALHRGRNPIFYVSSSPWNLYELLDDFMAIHGIPHGPMFLQDWGVDEDTLILDAHETHKLAQISALLEYYPETRFLLIGDSGQRDPEIYLQVIQANAGRIAGVFIRDVTGSARDAAVNRIIDEARAMGVDIVYVSDSESAMIDAKRMGLL